MAKKPEGVPTRQEQRRFLDLNSRRLSLWQLLKQVELVEERHKEEDLPVAVSILLQMVKDEHARADNEVKSFLKKHPSKAFPVFDPDDIEAASVDDNYDEVGTFDV